MEINPPKEPIRVVVVGHVDHGKSTFIGRFLFDSENLTSDKLFEIKQRAEETGKPLEFAHVMDQFREEREQNITIDTAQTFFGIKGQPYVFIDAPGHKEYLKNMITGATQAENALLILDAAEGVREQTDKHVQILKWLEITQLAVLINKMDLVKHDSNHFDKLKSDVKSLLATHKMTANQIIPVSAAQGDNIVKTSTKMPWYTGPTVIDFIKRLSPQTAKQDQNSDAQFMVQMRHNVNKDLVFLGRVEKGGIKKGDKLKVFPTNDDVTVKQILKYQEKCKEAQAGDSVALELAGSTQINRGYLLYSGEEPYKSVNKIVSQTFWASNQSLKINDEIMIECRTQSAKGVVHSIMDPLEDSSREHLDGGDIGVIEFQVDGPLFVRDSGASDPFSRIVLQREDDVVGCGVVQKAHRSED